MHTNEIGSFNTPLFPDLDGDNNVEYFFNNHHGLNPERKPICSAGGTYDNCTTYVFGRVNESDIVQPVDVDIFLTDQNNRDKYKKYKKYDSHGGAILDIDGDGHLDLYMNNGGGDGVGTGMNFSSVLYWGSESVDDTKWTITGGHESALAAGLENHGGDGRGRTVYFADFNTDGLLDVLLINDLRKDGLLTPSQIFYNKGNRTFQPDPFFREYVKIAIFSNNVGVVHKPAKDLIIQRSECHGKDEAHVTFCKTRAFKSWAVYRYSEDDQGMKFVKDLFPDTRQNINIQAEDLNGDGMMDLFLASRAGNMRIFYSDIGEDIISSKGASEEIPPPNNCVLGMAVVDDFDLDGSLDILAVYENKKKGNYVLAMYSRDQNASMPPYWVRIDQAYNFPPSNALPFGKGKLNDIASIDYNNDGLMDVVFSSQTFPHLYHLTNIFTSTNCQQPNYIAIVLQGSSNVNLYAIGSSLKLKCYDEKMKKFQEFYKIVNTYSHGTTKDGGATDHRIVFGLGYGSKPISLSIVWPDGRKTYATRRKLRKSIYNMTNPLVVKHSNLPSQNKCVDMDVSFKFKTSKSKNLTCSRIYNLSENEKDDICGQVVSDKKRKNRVGIYILCPVTCGACYNLRRF